MPIPPYSGPPSRIGKLVAGPNVTLSPSSGVGASVTISASVGGGGGSPLTTKGDLYGYSTTGARLPVAYDGIPLQSASVQTLGLGYGTQTYNMNAQNVGNAAAFMVNESALINSPGFSGLEIANGASYTTGPTYYGINIVDSPTFNTTNLNGTSAWINVGGNWTVNKVGSKATIFGMNFSPNWSGTGIPAQFGGIKVAPQFLPSTGTLATMFGINLLPSSSANVTVTKMIGVTIGLNPQASGTTGVGLDIGITNILSATTNWAMQIGNYNSYFNGNTTFGGTGTPTYAVHVRGGNASVSAIGLDVSTVPPVEPGSSGAMAIQCYEGSGGTNRYLLVSYNDAGTQRYKYVILNGTGVTWTESTLLPT